MSLEGRVNKPYARWLADLAGLLADLIAALLRTQVERALVPGGLGICELSDRKRQIQARAVQSVQPFHSF